MSKEVYGPQYDKSRFPGPLPGEVNPNAVSRELGLKCCQNAKKILQVAERRPNEAAARFRSMQSKLEAYSRVA